VDVRPAGSSRGGMVGSRVAWIGGMSEGEEYIGYRGYFATLTQTGSTVLRVESCAD